MHNTGISFTVCAAPDAAEPKPTYGETPADFAVRAALSKAKAVLSLQKEHSTNPDTTTMVSYNSLIIAADTVVALEGAILGKPQNQEQAYSFLRMLSGTSHEVITGCAIAFRGKMDSFFVRTNVSFGAFPEAVLKSYAASEEVKDKAGAYAIQGIGAFLVTEIEGSWTNVVGLPVAELLSFLLAKGLIIAE